jgi:hypothetical protein
MPCKARLDVPRTLHYVMVRGIEGSNIFRDEGDRNTSVDRIKSLNRDRTPNWGGDNGGGYGHKKNRKKAITEWNEQCPQSPKVRQYLNWIKHTKHFYS